ncbi:hypothetical protein BE08_08585 [Sorangium cellulosum]|uniref:Secreted protein n=1 Tax=Sorangium cellulosum TaxID=56 RepID=A0A150NY96_SORCE|nr:hypothetical protein BE08_08585 [Sorangium cellulosum]
MLTHFTKRSMSVLLASLLASFALIGCQAEVVDGPSPDVEVGEADQPLLNCKGQCARFFILCVQSTDDYELCAADRDACMEDCEERTCEPGEPGCCQGQPTCW